MVTIKKKIPQPPKETDAKPTQNTTAWDTESKVSLLNPFEKGWHYGSNFNETEKLASCRWRNDSNGLTWYSTCCRHWTLYVSFTNYHFLWSVLILITLNYFSRAKCFRLLRFYGGSLPNLPCVTTVTVGFWSFGKKIT